MIDEAQRSGLSRLDLEPGDYAGPVLIRGELHLVGSPRGKTSIINGAEGERGSVIVISEASRATLEDLHIRGGRARDDKALGAPGSGVRAMKRSSLTLIRVTVSDCESFLIGSAVAAEENSNLVIQSAQFSGNRGEQNRLTPTISIGRNASAVVQGAKFSGNQGGYEIGVIHPKAASLRDIEIGEFITSPRRSCGARIVVAANPKVGGYRLDLNSIKAVSSSCTFLMAEPIVDITYANMEWPGTPPDNARKIGGG